ncbi:MAG: hypothetical protein IJM18_11285, partial [Clostridia bacterium]|nr:hypothetical protein [Clostridia bacterium]
MFKKIIAITLCVLMLPVMTVTCVSAQPLTTSAGIEALRDQFLDGTGPSVNGLVIDYCYYAPDKEYMTDKYPLVIWLHGLVSGGYPRRQITKNDISNWSALEFQYRFPQGGAFILAPRSPEVVADWADNLIEPLKATIDDFIQQHYDMIDPTRIYIGGLS